jgi:hypothetical protein
MIESTGEDKKVYETPELVTYGDVRTLTSAAGNMGAGDGGGGSTAKTA